MDQELGFFSIDQEDNHWAIVFCGIFSANFPRVALFSIYFDILPPEWNATIARISYAEGSNFILAIISIGIINVIYEELFIIGYFGDRLLNKNPVIFCGISVLIWLSYHTYQGITVMIPVFVFGLLGALYFVKYKRILPIMIAHSIINITIVYLSYFT